MKRVAVIGSVAWISMLGCDQSPTTAPSPAVASVPAPGAKAQVRWFGALRAIMHEGRTVAAVQLADVIPGPHAWGLGALEGLQGEVTVLDDAVWLARPRSDGTASVTRGDLMGVDKAQGATLLVVANVSAWDELPVPDRVAWSELDAFLESQLEARGVALDAPVPLRIDGPVGSLRWHVVDGTKMAPGGGHAEHMRSAVTGMAERVDAELVGFFSRGHEGVFTHAGSYSHFHVVTRDGLLTGHVDAVDILPTARLLVPRQ